MSDLKTIKNTTGSGYRERELAAAQLLEYLPIRLGVERPPRAPGHERTPLRTRVARVLRHREWHEDARPKVLERELSPVRR